MEALIKYLDGRISSSHVELQKRGDYEVILVVGCLILRRKLSYKKPGDRRFMQLTDGAYVGFESLRFKRGVPHPVEPSQPWDTLLDTLKSVVPHQTVIGVSRETLLKALKRVSLVFYGSTTGGVPCVDIVVDDNKVTCTCATDDPHIGIVTVPAEATGSARFNIKVNVTLLQLLLVEVIGFISISLGCDGDALIIRGEEDSQALLMGVSDRSATIGDGVRKIHPVPERRE